MPNEKRVGSDGFVAQGAVEGPMDFIERRRADLLREREIVLHFDDVNFVLERTRDLSRLSEDLLREPFKGRVRGGAGGSTQANRSPDSTRIRVLNHVEEDMLFVRNLRRVALRFGGLEMVHACSLEIANFEVELSALRRSVNNERPNGILALLGVER